MVLCHVTGSVRTYHRYLHREVVRTLVRRAAHFKQAFLFRVEHDNHAESRGLRVEHLKPRNDRMYNKTTTEQDTTEGTEPKRKGQKYKNKNKIIESNQINECRIIDE